MDIVTISLRVWLREVTNPEGVVIHKLPPKVTLQSTIFEEAKKRSTSYKLTLPLHMLYLLQSIAIHNRVDVGSHG